MEPSGHDWYVADKAYQAHHSHCPQCRAAGMAPGGRGRCPSGAALWDAYQKAGDPPHFMWPRPSGSAMVSTE